MAKGTVLILFLALLLVVAKSEEQAKAKPRGGRQGGEAIKFSPQTGPSIPLRVWDFTAGGKDFDAKWKGGEVVKGMVKQNLEEGLPVFSGTPGAREQVTSGSSFSTFFKSSPNNIELQEMSIPLDEEGGLKIYSYSFFPANKQGFRDLTERKSLFFTAHLQFQVNFDNMKKLEGAAIKAGSSDDLWIFLNGKLFIDLGGKHSLQVQRTFLPRNLTLGVDHTVDVFFASRSLNQPRLILHTNFALSLPKSAEKSESGVPLTCNTGSTPPPSWNIASGGSQTFTFTVSKALGGGYYFPDFLYNADGGCTNNFAVTIIQTSGTHFATFSPAQSTDGISSDPSQYQNPLLASCCLYFDQLYFPPGTYCLTISNPTSKICFEAFQLYRASDDAQFNFASAGGDPHVRTINSDKFELTGRPGSAYSFFDSPQLKISGSLSSFPGKENTTFITDLAITLSEGRRVRWGKADALPVILDSNTPIKEGESLFFKEENAILSIKKFTASTHRGKSELFHLLILTEDVSVVIRKFEGDDSVERFDMFLSPRQGSQLETLKRDEQLGGLLMAPSHKVRGSPKESEMCDSFIIPSLFPSESSQLRQTFSPPSQMAFPDTLFQRQMDLYHNTGAIYYA